VKYSIITFGCRVNQADSLGFEESLRERGATAAPPEDADVVIVNTCSVTASADQGARQTIRRIARTNPSARIVVTGCYATRRPDDVAILPNVVRVVTNPDKDRLVGYLTTAERFGDGEGSCGAAIEPGVAGRTAFTLRVQTGCDEQCSYCIIPSTRGLPRSLAPEKVRAEVARVAAAGFKEIALTGVHLGSYGEDLALPATMFELLKSLVTSETERRVSDAHVLFRISSLEPMDCTPEIVRLVAEHDCFAPHFHLPLQHASNRLLEAMRRPYTIEHYALLVDDIRTRIPHAAIGSDIIVGFPGETEEDVVQLLTYLESSPLTHLHVFPYSERPGTEATGMAHKVPGDRVRDRARRVRELSARLSARFHADQVGRVFRALTIEDGSLAVTGNYLKLRIPPGLPRNEWIQVRVGESVNSVVE
jgi:threonylcarbamoyladenosine tRNA methylthiotransferase MtaB